MANLPLESRPRGLGELAEQASGFGTWVVDMRWGLSPKLIGGQNRPYGPAVVQTYYPRSQAPRLTALQTGGVIAAGTWPDLLPATTSPVFRTPVTRPGVQQMSLPPGAGVTNGTALAAAGMQGLAGYGYVPLGVAQPPTEMYERGVSGFGEEPTAGTLPDNLTVLGKNIALTPNDWTWIQANAAVLQRTLFAWIGTYVARQHQFDYFNFAVHALGAVQPDYAARRSQAMQVAFGGPEGYQAAYRDLTGIDRIRKDLKAQLSAADLAAMPANVRNAVDVFFGRDTPSPVGYGALPVALAAYGGWKLIAAIAGLLAVGAGGTYVYYQVSGVAAKNAMAESEVRRREAELAARQAELKMAETIQTQIAPTLSMQARTGATEAERLAAIQGLTEIAKQFDAVRGKASTERSAAGGGGHLVMYAIGLGLVGLLVFGGYRFTGRGNGHTESERAPARGGFASRYIPALEGGGS